MQILTKYSVLTHIRISTRFARTFQNSHGREDGGEDGVDAALLGVEADVDDVRLARQGFGDGSAKVTHHVLVISLAVKNLRRLNVKK